MILINNPSFYGEDVTLSTIAMTLSTRFVGFCSVVAH
jgi:hypothetical protein